MSKKPVKKKSDKIPKKAHLKKTTEAENIISLTNELGEEKQKFIRLFAEFENYKKRTSKERVDLFKTANKDLMITILPVKDDFDRALKEIYKNKKKADFEGFILIHNKLNEVLKQKGLLEIEDLIGSTFNSEVHEAISQIPCDKKDKGKILEVIEKGYSLGDKIIRFPKVIVGN
jgi:molecular chaperone GrpE